MPSDGRCNLLLIYNNIIQGFPPEAPTHWNHLRIGIIYALEGPTHWKALRIGIPYTLEDPKHWKPLRTGSPYALEYFIYIYKTFLRRYSFIFFYLASKPPDTPLYAHPGHSH